MLTVSSSDEKQNTCFKFIGCSDTSSNTTHLISNTTSLLSSDTGECGFDSCSFYSGPSEASILAFGESCEAAGSIAYAGSGESCGSIAYSGGGESCGSIASASVSTSSSGGFSGGGCSYSC